MTSESYAITPADMAKVNADYEAIKAAAIRHGCWAVPYARLPKSEAHNLALFALVQEAVQAEREACAKVADGLKTNPPPEIDDVERGFNCGVRRAAMVIRSRGQQ